MSLQIAKVAHANFLLKLERIVIHGSDEEKRMFTPNGIINHFLSDIYPSYSHPDIVQQYYLSIKKEAKYIIRYDGMVYGDQYEVFVFDCETHIFVLSSNREKALEHYIGKREKS